MPTSIADFVEQLRQARVLDAAQLQAISRDPQDRHPDGKSLAKELVRRGWLTAFQANELLKGRGKELAIGPYVLIDKLGEGGMGTVYKARHQMMKRSVALKVLLPSGLSGAAIQRFQQEIEAAAALSHPHIVVAHDAGRAGDLFYFAMEHLEGATLQQVVQQRGPLPIADACQYAVQTALALQHSAEKGLVHRDLKPANLFLTSGGTIKLLDLGLARVQVGSAEKGGRALTRLGAIMGTPDYMPPEQISDARYVDIRGDIYSLGCTLYVLLTGKTPFRGKSLAEKMDSHRKTPAPSVRALRPDVPEGLDAVVRKMMAKDPVERYQTPAEVVEALRPFVAAVPLAAPLHAPVAVRLPEDTVAANSATTAGLAAPRPKRRRWALLAAAVLAVLVSALGTWLWKGGKETKSPEKSTGVPYTNEPIVIGEPIRVRFDSRWLDALDPAKIPAVERYSWQPKELVAVLGEHRLRGVLVAIRPDGKQIASSNLGNPYLGPYSVLLGDAETLHVRQALPIRASALAYSPDSRLLALAVDAVVQLLDPDSGAEVRKLEGPDAATSGVTTVSFSSDGKSLLAGDSLGKLWLWDVATGKRLHKLDAHSSTVKSIACGAGGLAVSGGGPGDATLCLWNLETGKKLAHVDFRDSKLDLNSYVNCVAITRDGKKVLSAHSDKSVRLWDCKVDALKEVRRLEDHHAVPGAVAFSPDGQKIATAIGYDNPSAVRLWETVSGKELLKIHQAIGGSLAFSPDGKRLVLANTVVRVHNVETGKELQPPLGHLTSLQCAALAPTGRYLASGDNWYGGCRMWDLAGTTFIRLRLREIADTFTWGRPSSQFCSGTWKPACPIPSHPLIPSPMRGLSPLRVCLWMSVISLSVRSRPPPCVI
jgi:eukaryotic-like serine/threonine-protein kinase